MPAGAGRRGQCRERLGMGMDADGDGNGDANKDGDGMGVSLQPFCCPLGLRRALHSTSFSPACRAASCLPGLTSPGRKGRGQGLSTS